MTATRSPDRFSDQARERPAIPAPATMASYRERSAIHRDIVGPDDLCTDTLHLPPGLIDGAIDIDASCTIFDHMHAEALFPAIVDGPSDTEIGRKSADVDVGETPLAQITSKSGLRLMVILVEGGVGVHLLDRKSTRLNSSHVAISY